MRKADRITIVRITDVETIESAGNYVAVRAGKETLIVRETLLALMKQLAPHKFMRVSRSAIVNLDHVKEVLPHFAGRKLLVLQSGKRLSVTLRWRDIEEALKFA